MTKKVLFIAYYFPPMGGSGVQRSTKFVKYLPQFGWEPLVLTAIKPAAASHDETLLREIPENASVSRTRHFDIADRYAEGDRKKAAKEKEPSPEEDSAVISEEEEKESAWKRFTTWLKSPLRWLVNFPDRHIGWLPWAIPAALKIIRQHQPEIIYITGDPFSSFVMGPLLKILTGKPYVLDFRDEWTGFLSAPGNVLGRSQSSDLERKLEGWTVRGASKVVSVTEGMAHNLRRTHNRQPSEKFTVIQNGYDAEDFAEDSKMKIKGEPFTLSYVGMLGPLHFERSFFEAFRQVTVEDASLAKNCRVNFVGRVWDSLKPEVETYQNENIRFHGYRPHAEAVEILRSSDVLLMLLSSKPGLERAMSGKIYEYIAAGKPILAVTPEGEVSRFLKTYPRGIHVLSGDVAGIQQALRQLYQIHQEGRDFASIYDLGPLPQFQRRTQAGQLAAVFNEVTSGKPLKNDACCLDGNFPETECERRKEKAYAENCP